MYKNFYRLEDNPFRLSPDPNYFVASERTVGVLDRLKYGIEQGVGFMMITGEVGVGKTSLLRYLLKNLDHSVERALLYNPTLNYAEDLLKYIMLDWGVRRRFSKETGKVELIVTLLANLTECYRKGKKFLLVIDEAHTIPDHLLEEIRLLSNFEADNDKLIQIILIGQPELKKRINTTSFRQLRQRIAISAELSSLKREEVEAYLRHRLSVAGSSNEIFHSSAVRAITKASKGLPRLINLIAERSLIAGYITSKQVVKRKEVKAALKDLDVA